MVSRIGVTTIVFLTCTSFLVLTVEKGTAQYCPGGSGPCGARCEASGSAPAIQCAPQAMPCFLSDGRGGYICDCSSSPKCAGNRSVANVYVIGRFRCIDAATGRDAGDITFTAQGGDCSQSCLNAGNYFNQVQRDPCRQSDHLKTTTGIPEWIQGGSCANVRCWQ
jgi:hypothetical protein